MHRDSHTVPSAVMNSKRRFPIIILLILLIIVVIPLAPLIPLIPVRPPRPHFTLPNPPPGLIALPASDYWARRRLPSTRSRSGSDIALYPIARLLSILRRTPPIDIPARVAHAHIHTHTTRHPTIARLNTLVRRTIIVAIAVVGVVVIVSAAVMMVRHNARTHTYMHACMLVQTHIRIYTTGGYGTTASEPHYTPHPPYRIRIRPTQPPSEFPSPSYNTVLPLA
ncbi:hypothetical protein C8Q78DRAFT_14133 [Trametes maxima]|nr:hypothetical protein C8Q78DRAFT_14133 [Trametes maxima]